MMRKMLIAALVCLACPAQAQWAAYPGATRDTASETKAAEVSKAAGMGGAAPIVLLTPDSFEKVLDFYRGRGKESRIPPLPGQTNPWLDIPGVSAADAGTYDVIAYSTTLVPLTSQPAVLSLNAAPTFSGYTFVALKDQPTTVLFAKFLARSADADGDPLTVSAASAATTAGGTAAITAGGVLYSPPAGYTGADSFTVTISDDHGASVTGTVNVTVNDGSDPGANQASIALNGDGTVDVVFHGIPGRSYQMQRSTDLSTWTVLTTLTAAPDGTLPYHDPSPPPGAAFYRTREP